MSYVDLLAAMRKNAPSVYHSYVDKKTMKLNKRLEELRNLYKRAMEDNDGEEMKAIEKNAAEIKKDLQIYLDVEAQTSLI